MAFWEVFGAPRVVFLRFLVDLEVLEVTLGMPTKALPLWAAVFEVCTKALPLRDRPSKVSTKPQL